jgi:hypothetical protein
MLLAIAIAALCYHFAVSAITRSRVSDARALYLSAVRASDLEQWHSIDPE